MDDLWFCLTVQNYTYFFKQHIENRTSSLQTACKFIAPGRKKHCKLYKTRKECNKNADFIGKSTSCLGVCLRREIHQN